MLGRFNNRIPAALVAAAMTLSACASGNPGEPKTALDRSVGDCISSIAVGALVGALIGSAAGRRNVGTGAAVGAGVGTVACAVIVAANNKRDREQIRQARLAALQSGRDETANYIGDDGNARMVHTSVQSVAMPEVKPALASGGAFTGVCRRAQTQITIASKGTANLDPELVCQTTAGDWVAVPEKKTV